MNKSLRSFTFALVFAVFAMLGATASRAQTVIDHLPYIITTKGLYVLNSDLSSTQTNGTLISVQANNVTIDFQDHFIAGPGSSATQTVYGVRASERSNVIIKNGTIAYCYYGIRLDGNNTSTTNAVGEVVDNMHVTYCTYVGISVVYCPASRITNCQVSKIGLSSFSASYGIEGSYQGTLVANNIVSNVVASSVGYGILNNNGFSRENTIYNATDGVYGGKYQDNLTFGCTNNVTGGTDAGGNN